MDTPSPLAAAPGTARQGEIYIQGMLHQKREAVPTSQHRLEEAAGSRHVARSLRLRRRRRRP